MWSIWHIQEGSKVVVTAYTVRRALVYAHVYELYCDGSRAQKETKMERQEENIDTSIRLAGCKRGIAAHMREVAVDDQLCKRVFLIFSADDIHGQTAYLYSMI